MSIQSSYPNNNGKAFVGLILLAVGGILLFNELDFFYYPNWIFSWPMILIAVGLYSGVKQKFHNSSWMIVTGIGVVFLLDKIIPSINIPFFPILIIGLGLWVILKRNRPNTFKHDPDFNNWQAKQNDPFARATEVNYAVEPDTSATSATPGTENGDFTSSGTGKSFNGYGDDYIDATSVFGSYKKIIVSKNFKGGEIVNVFGGSELDFTQADINGRVVIDITQLFGGIKMVVPPHWQIQSDVAAIFAGVDDKRMARATPLSADKILVLKGTSIFAGVDIRSF